MIPFIAEDRNGGRCLVVGFVWGREQLLVVILKADRSIDCEEAENLRLQMLHAQMPNIFEWPEDDLR